jgi:hypothetical protein
VREKPQAPKFVEVSRQKFSHQNFPAKIFPPKLWVKVEKTGVEKNREVLTIIIT